MITRRKLSLYLGASLIPSKSLAVPLVHAGGAKPQHQIAPQLMNVVNVADANYSIIAGNYLCNCGFDSSVRFNFNLAQMINGATYRINFTIISISVGSVYADFCDVEPQQGALNVGLISFTASKAVYDNTYRFVDIGTDEVSVIPNTIFLVTPPTITQIP